VTLIAYVVAYGFIILVLAMMLDKVMTKFMNWLFKNEVE
jgi:hypothetical protein